MNAIRFVGVPRDELELHRALVRPGLLHPGRGRSVVFIPEADLRFGRADLLALFLNQAALKAHRRSGVRFKSETHARAAAWSLLGETQDVTALLGVSDAHAKAVIRSVQAMDRGALARAAALVTYSVVIEAKVTDWRRAVLQTRRYAHLVDDLAIAMPDAALKKVPRDLVRRTGIGLIGIESQHARWVRRPRGTIPALGARLWLAEIAARTLDGV